MALFVNFKLKNENFKYKVSWKDLENLNIHNKPNNLLDTSKSTGTSGSSSRGGSGNSLTNTSSDKKTKSTQKDSRSNSHTKATLTNEMRRKSISDDEVSLSLSSSLSGDEPRPTKRLKKLSASSSGKSAQSPALTKRPTSTKRKPQASPDSSYDENDKNESDNDFLNESGDSDAEFTKSNVITGRKNQEDLDDELSQLSESEVDELISTKSNNPRSKTQQLNSTPLQTRSGRNRNQTTNNNTISYEARRQQRIAQQLEEEKNLVFSQLLNNKPNTTNNKEATEKKTSENSIILRRTYSGSLLTFPVAFYPQILQKYKTAIADSKKDSLNQPALGCTSSSSSSSSITANFNKGNKRNHQSTLSYPQREKCVVCKDKDRKYVHSEKKQPICSLTCYNILSGS